MNFKKYLLKISSFVSLPLVSLASISCSNNQNIPPVDYEMINKETGLAFNSKGEITKYYYYEGNDFTNITIPEYLVNNAIPSSQYYGYKQRITSIGYGVFSAETKYENGVDVPIYNKYAKDLKNIILPNSITNIGPDAFYGTQLTEIAFPDSIVSIGDSAFRYCKTLSNIKLSKNIKYIGTNSFFYSNLNGFLFIPDSIMDISSGAFNGTKIAEVSIPNDYIYVSDSFPPNCKITVRNQQ